MRQVKLLVPVRHDGKDYKAGDTLPPMPDEQATRLVALKAATYSDGKAMSTADDDNGDDTLPNGTEDIANMKNKDLIAALQEKGVKLTGRENKAELQALLTEAWENTAKE